MQSVHGQGMRAGLGGRQGEEDSFSFILKYFKLIWGLRLYMVTSRLQSAILITSEKCLLPYKSMQSHK